MPGVYWNILVEFSHGKRSKSIVHQNENLKMPSKFENELFTGSRHASHPIFFWPQILFFSRYFRISEIFRSFKKVKWWMNSSKCEMVVPYFESRPLHTVHTILVSLGIGMSRARPGKKRSGINLRQIPCSAGLSFRIINNACRLWTASITHSRLKRQLVLENKSSIGDVWWKEGEPPEAWAQAWALSLDVDGRFQYDLIWLRLDLFVYSLHL